MKPRWRKRVELTPNEEQRMLIELVRRFIREEILPLEETLDQDAYELPPADRERLVAKVKAMGLYQMDAPPEFGGPGIDLVTRVLLAEEMSQHRAGLYYAAYGVFGRDLPPQLYAATDSQKERYLFPVMRGEKKSFWGITEPSGGSDPARAIETRAVRDGDYWIVNGAKVFASAADHADFGLVFVRTDKSQGRRGITCLLVDTDTPGFAIRRRIPTLRSAPTNEVTFEDMRVPVGNTLGEEGAGFAIANELLSRNRIPYAAVCNGVAIVAHRMATEYSRQRSTFGELLSSRQAVQWMLVDNEIDIRCSRWLCLAAADRAERKQPYRFEAAMAKLYATEAAGRVVDRSMQIHGGYGVTRDLPLERWFRELRIRRITEGPSEVQRMIMARDLTTGTVRAGALPE